LWILVLFASNTVRAEDQPVFDELQQRIKSRAVNLGALLQVVGDGAPSSWSGVNSGFVLANFRASLSGELDRGVSYMLQTSFLKSPAILDARLSVTAPGEARLSGGAFKAPFGAEFLVSAADIDLVNRSQAVTLLVPGRQVGFSVAGPFLGRFRYDIGAFNGNGIRILNDDDNLMGAARITARAGEGTRTLLFGVNGFASDDNDAPIGVPITGDFLAEGYTGTRSAFGGDVRLERDEWLIASEWIWARFDPRGGDRVEPWGYHVTLGYKPREDSQLLVRWDSVTPDGVLADSDQLILGANWFPSTPTEVQLNLVVPTSDSRGVRLLLNAQIKI
jgi:hypothetical protein